MQITNFQDALPGTSLVATFDLYIPEWQMTIHNMKVMRSKKKGTLFSCAPSYYISDASGAKKYLPYFTFSAERQADFNKAVWDELQPFIRNK